MNPRLKKVVLVTVKVAILAGIVEYVRRQSQIGDEIAVPALDQPGAAMLAERGAATGSGSDPRFALRGIDGGRVEVRPVARLKVLEKRIAPPVYRALTPQGGQVDILAGDIEGTSGKAAADDRPFVLLSGLRTLFENLDFRLLALAFALFGPPLFLMAVRWRLLLVLSNIHIPFFTILRLHYLGFFFNTFMPGGAGGDIIKAVYVARHCSQKAEAATMVLIDRVVGMVGLLVMAGTVVLADYRRMHGIALQVGAISLALAVGALLFFSSQFRKLVRYEQIIAKLPRHEVILRIDRALYDLRHHKTGLALGLSLTLGLQLIEVVGVWFAGRAVGIYKASFTHYLAFVPIGYLVNALPISFGGIGLMEGAYLKLFRDAGVATGTQGFMLGVLARLIVIGWSLLGALSALFPPEDKRSDAPDEAAAPATVTRSET